MRVLRIIVGVLALLGVAVALAPEPPAKAIPGMQVNILRGKPDQRPLGQVLDRDTSVHAAAMADENLMLSRSWTPAGVKPLELEIGPIAPVAFLGIAYQGAARDPDAKNALYLRCSSNGRTRSISTGGSNSTILETVTPLGPGWCPNGQVHLRIVAASDAHNLGVVQPYEVAPLAALKHSYLGYAGYFLIGFGIVFSVFFGGGLVARASRSGLDPVLGGLMAVGAASLLAFYLYAWTPTPAPAGLVLVAALVGGAGLAAWRRPALTRSVWRAQSGPAQAWFLVAFTAFTILHLGGTGSGNWEPSYRYAPAIWSSDHTLPMLFAEAARIGSFTTQGLGDWSLSDRPPLLAGGYLLLGDTYAALQRNNDGSYLQPIVLGVGGIVFCGLWAATFYWAARRIGRLGPRTTAVATFLVAVTPFAIFNTGYTWPKLLAAAFSLAAAAYAFRSGARGVRVGEAVSYGALSAFAILSHAASAFFLAPVSLIYLALRLRRSPRAMMAGVAVGLAILASWSGFKASVLPSADPLMKYALTGDYGFDRDESVAELIAERYARTGVWDWISTKGEAAAYLFTPFPRQGDGALARPATSPDKSSDDIGKLRNWDFFSLTLGNLPILLLGGGALLVVVRRPRPTPAAIGVAGRLLLASSACYGFFVLTTFLPLIVHQFSYDAILGLALAGVIAIGSLRGGRGLLTALAAVAALYTAIVWVAAPIGQLLYLDLAAVLALAAVAGSLALAWFRPVNSSPGRAATWLGAVTAVVLGVLLLNRPASLIIDLAPQAALGTSSTALGVRPDAARCTGYFDAVAPRKAGGGRAYGWAWDIKAAAPPVAVDLTDGQGRHVASATLGAERPDVVAARPDVTALRLGWWANVPDNSGDLRAVATLADGSRCAVLGDGN
jgi:hypothetical protein